VTRRGRGACLMRRRGGRRAGGRGAEAVRRREECARALLRGSSRAAGRGERSRGARSESEAGSSSQPTGRPRNLVHWQIHEQQQQKHVQHSLSRRPKSQGTSLERDPRSEKLDHGSTPAALAPSRPCHSGSYRGTLVAPTRTHKTKTQPKPDTLYLRGICARESERWGGSARGPRAGRAREGGGRGRRTKRDECVAPIPGRPWRTGL